VAPDEAFPTEASGGRRDGDVSKPRKKSNWWCEAERVMLPVAIFPKVTVGLTAARAFGALAMRADNKSGLVDSTYEQIAEDAGMSRGQAAEGVRRLIDLGWIEQVRKGNSRVSNKYQLRAAPVPLDRPDLRTVKGPENKTVNRPGSRTVNRPENPSRPSGDPDSLLSLLTSSPTTSLAVGEKSKKKRTRHAYTTEFEQAWRDYPERDTGKGSKFNAFREWREALKVDGVTAESLLAAVRTYAKSVGDRWPKDMERWLKGRMWETVTASPARGTADVSFDALLASADAKTAADLIRVPYADPSQHPADPTPRAHWLRARRLEWIEAHEQEIRAALARRAS